MSLQKAGGTNIDNTVVPANAAALIDHLETHLVGAGWSIISGGGTDAIKFQSAATLDGMQVRIQTNVSGSEVTLTLTNVAETAVGTTGLIRLAVDGSSTWRLMANKFAFVLFQDTAPVILTAAGAKKWCMAGTLYLESFLTPTITEIGFLFGDHRSTTLDTHQDSFRMKAEYEGTPGVYTLLYNGALSEADNINSNSYEEGDPGLLTPNHAQSETTNYNGNPTKLLQWVTGEHYGSDAVMAWGTPSRTANFKTGRGQLFDVVHLADDNLNRGDVVTIGADSFRVFTDGAASANQWPYALAWLQP